MGQAEAKEIYIWATVKAAEINEGALEGIGSQVAENLSKIYGYTVSEMTLSRQKVVVDSDGNKRKSWVGGYIAYIGSLFRAKRARGERVMRYVESFHNHLRKGRPVLMRSFSQIETEFAHRAVECRAAFSKEDYTETLLKILDMETLLDEMKEIVHEKQIASGEAETETAAIAVGGTM